MVSALASVRAAAVVAALSAAFGGAVAALVVAGPDEAAVVVAFELPLLSPPQAASRAASDSAPPPASTERRVNPPPKPNVPGSMGGIVSSWWKSVGESGVSMDVHPPWVRGGGCARADAGAAPSVERGFYQARSLRAR